MDEHAVTHPPKGFRVEFEVKYGGYVSVTANTK